MATHHFRTLQERDGLSDSQLLDANNRHVFDGKADVVISGAGMIGLCYAIHLKTKSPELKIEIYEKNPAPCQKIGESTLSPFSKFVAGEVIPQDYFLRLFGIKDGLQLYHCDAQGEEVAYNDVGGLDITYQLDRRMSELLFVMWAQNLGINVYHGVSVDFDVDRRVGEFNTPRVLLKNGPGEEVAARIVCDASGFSRRLTSKFGARQIFDGGYNCNAFWAYFKQKGFENVDSQLDNWDYPATNHMAFSEGWGWFIPLISWHHASQAKLMDMVAYLIDSVNRQVPADSFPSTRELSKNFDCPFELIWSIGWAVRNDCALPDDLSSYGTGEGEQKFNYFKKKYPHLDQLVNTNYTLLPNYYWNKTYFTKKALAYQSPVVAGSGWFAVGNSAGFTNPLISPGINAGLAGAWKAAEMTAAILQDPALMPVKAEAYQRYIHDWAMPRLNRMNRMLYASFRDRRMFLAVTRCFWPAVGDNVGQSYDHEHFAESDANWLVGAGVDVLQDFAEKILQVLEPGHGPVSESQVRQVQAISDQFAVDCNTRHPNIPWGRWLRQWDSELRMSEQRGRKPGFGVWAYKCPGCAYFIHNNATMCPICGKGADRAAAEQGAAQLTLAA